MTGNKERVRAFMESLKMDYTQIDMHHECGIFLEEMEKGLKGQNSSLEMIPTYITMNQDVAVNEPIIVMDAGGTNFRVAVVHFDEDKRPVIEDFKMYPMPGTQGEIGNNEFFDTIADYMEPVLHKSNKIGFCFSYATEILPNKDGRLLHFCKEVVVRDVEGELIGAGLMEAIRNAGHKEQKSIVLINDTVATLLGGKAATPNRTFDSYMGFILGTGTNTCYIEDVPSIQKLKGFDNPATSMLVNVESGGYALAPRGSADIAYDNTTINPGQYKLEKMIAGAYQGGLMLTLIRHAVETGLLSSAFGKKLQNVTTLSTIDINTYLYYPYGENPLASCCSVEHGRNADDREVLYYLINAVVERAAKLTAINLASVMMKTGKGHNPCQPICIAADGSTFFKSKLFKSKLEYYVKHFMEDELGIYCEFIKAEDSTLTGSAIAAF